MTNPSSDSFFRDAAESEGGIPVSAGARVMHVRLAEETGKGIVLNLGDVPVDRRSSLIEELRELVRRAEASAKDSTKPPAPPSEPS
jgi:hypothetical protein